MGFGFPTAVSCVVIAFFLLLAIFPFRDMTAGQTSPPLGEPARAPLFYCRVLRSFPHDTGAFTQGLLFHDGYLFESTGLYGQSTLRKIDPASGKVVTLVPLGPGLFGEGLALNGNTLVQLTWREGVGLLYDVRTLERKGSFSYAGEGWGIASDGKHLFMSDGSARIRVLDPSNYREVKRLTVKDGSHSVSQLNELEFVNGELLANVYQSTMIVRFSPEDGKVAGWIDCTNLCLPAGGCEGEKVCNGIAYDPEGGRIFLTGKLWSRIYEVSFEPAPAGQ